MGIPLSEILDDDTGSMREQAAANNLPYEPFTMRELITPQYGLGDTGVDSSTEYWRNWVYAHDGNEDRTEYRPETREQLVAAVVAMAHSKGKVRAVGSGHSHSNAPAPPEHYIEFNPGDPKDTGEAGLNAPLDHLTEDGRSWLKTDDELAEIQEEEDHPGDETHPLDRDHLKRLQAGIILRRLNRHVLHDNGYALTNMGSFDGQTIAGAVNTSTHGTGVGLSSVADSVRGVEIATVPESESGDPIVRLFRIEPENGITDRERFERATGEHEMELIQDDDVFYSTVVGYGCLGVVYGYTLQVRDAYWLEERAELMSWNTLSSKLAGPDGVTEESVRAFLEGENGECRHTQILVNIAAEQTDRINNHSSHQVGEHEQFKNPVCLVRRHYPVEDPPEEPDGWKNPAVTGVHDPRWPPERRKKTVRDIAKAAGQINPLAPNLGKAKQMHNNLFHPEYRRKPFVLKREQSAWYVALRRLRDRPGPNTSQYRHPKPPSPPTVTTEVGVPLESVVDAINAVRGRIRRPNGIKQEKLEGKTWNADGRHVFFAIPMGVRFTAPSKHYLSPEHDRTTAMLEVPMPVNPLKANVDHQTPRLTVDEIRELVVEPALTELHDHLVFDSRSDPSKEFPARPHMGKHNTVDAEWLDENYKYFDASDAGEDGPDVGWYQMYERFNRFGTFDNKFTDQLELDEFTPAGPDGSDSSTDGDGSTGEDTPDGSDSSTDGGDGSTPEVSMDSGFDLLAGAASVGAAAYWLSQQSDGDGE